MKQVYTTTTVAEAELVRILLRRNRIPSMLEGDSGGIRGPATPLNVWVEDRFAGRAGEVIRAMLLKRRRARAASPRKRRTAPKSRRKASRKR